MFTGPNIIRDGLVLYLDAANINSYPGSGNTWSDLSGNGNNFTLFNGVSYNTTIKSLSLDGINDYIRSTNTLDLSIYNSITIESCFKDSNSSTMGPMIYEHSSNWNSNDSGFGLFLNSNGSSYASDRHHTNHRLGSGSVNYLGYVGTDVVIHTNIFSRVTDTTGRISYINSDNKTLISGSSTTSNYGSFRNDNFFIGSRNGQSAFKVIDIFFIRVYGRKLSPEEITQNFNATKSRYGL